MTFLFDRYIMLNL